MIQKRSPRIAPAGRRQLLKGLGALALSGALKPFIPQLGPRRASAQGTIPRPANLLLVWWPNGLETPWVPARTTGYDYPFSDVLRPLEPMRSQLLPIYGFKGVSDNEVMQHFIATPGTWTGYPGLRERRWRPLGPSIDQIVAARFGGDSLFPSLELGLRSSGVVGSFATIFDSSGEELGREEQPGAAFDRIFSASQGDPKKVAERRAQRGSVFDLVRAELNSIKHVYGKEDLQRIEQHQAGLREIEQRLDGLSRLTCDTKGFTPSSASLLEEAASQQDIAVLSLACGVTRVVSLQYFESISPVILPGPSERDAPGSVKEGLSSIGIHAIMHVGTRAQKLAVNTWFVAQFAQLLTKLSAVRFEDGHSLLDDTLVVFGSEMAVGNHLNAPIPYIIAGGGSYFRLGEFVKFEEPPRNTRLLLSVLHALGLEDIREVGGFRDEGERGPLPALRRFV